MPFTIKPTRGKASRVNKSLYLSEELANRLEQLAADNQTSFNNLVVSMIEYCLEEMDGSVGNGPGGEHTK